VIDEYVVTVSIVCVIVPSLFVLNILL